MSIRVTRALIVMAACLTGLGGCASSTKLSDLWAPKTSGASNTAASSDTPASDAPASDTGFRMNDLWAPKSADGTNWITGKPDSKSADTTGSVAITPAEPGPSGEPIAPGAKPGLLGDDPHDDLQLAKKYFRSNNFGLAEASFRSAAVKHPNDAEAWIGLAASYDRLRRFDLADRAYAQALRLVGPTIEVLNDEGFSYMLRGDYERAHKLLQQAQAKDPANPYVEANLKLLDDSFRDRKGVQ